MAKPGENSVVSAVAGESVATLSAQEEVANLDVSETVVIPEPSNPGASVDQASESLMASNTATSGTENLEMKTASAQVQVAEKVALAFMKTKVLKLWKSVLPEGFRVQDKAQHAVTKSAEAFARYLSFAAVDFMKDNNRTNLIKTDVLEALKECGFGHMLPTLERCSGQAFGEKEVRISLKDLVSLGILVPGENALSVSYKGHTIVAELTADAKIVYGSETFENPSAFSLRALQKIAPEKKSDNGWDSVQYKCESLNSYKAKAREKLRLQRASAKRQREEKTAKHLSNEDSSSSSSGEESGEGEPHKRRRQESPSKETDDLESQVLDVMGDD